MAPGTLLTRDGVRLEYIDTGGTGRVILLLHGLAGSSECFARVLPLLAPAYRCVAPTMRGHGSSEHPPYGHHVSRLAQDVAELMQHLGLESVVGVGCSIGAAVLWAYQELHGSERFSGFIYVDQSPWQAYAGDASWMKGSKSCHDAASVATFQTMLRHAPEELWPGFARACLGHQVAPEKFQHVTVEAGVRDVEHFGRIAAEANAEFIAKLMHDHTFADWRASIAHNSIRPVHVLASRVSDCFEPEAVSAVAEIINEARGQELATLDTVEWGGHWMVSERASSD